MNRKARLLALALLLAGAAAGAPAEDMSRFNVVAIKDSSTSVLIATVSMSMPPFVRHHSVYSSTYAAHVYPFFFYNEKGRIWINLTDDQLLQVAHGQPVDFTGQAVNENGDKRRVEGRATPTGRSSGKIKVRVFVSRRISISYDSTYELKGTAPGAPVTPR